jgi:hypothetical protein
MKVGCLDHLPWATIKLRSKLHWNNKEFHTLFFHCVKSHILAFFTKVLVLMKLGVLVASSGHFTNNFNIDKVYSGEQVLKLSNKIFIEE